MPVDAKTLAKELDGNPDMVNETVMAIEEVADSDPTVAQWWSSVKPKVGSGGAIDTESFVPEVIASLGLDKKTGVRGKKPDAEQTVNQSATPATDKADKDLLPNPPAGKGGKKAAAKKATAKAKDEKPAPQKPAAPKPAADIPGAFAPVDLMNAGDPNFSVTTDPSDLVSAAQGMDTADDVLNRTLNTPASTPSRMDPNDYLVGGELPDLVPFDQIGMMASAAPAPQVDLSARMGNAAPTAMDMSRLSGLPTLSAMMGRVDLGGLLDGVGRDGYTDPDIDTESMPLGPEPMGPQELFAPYRTGQFDSDFSQMSPMPEAALPGTINSQGGFGGSQYGPEPPVGGLGDGTQQSANNQPWSPLTSRSDAFFKARGLDGMASGARYLTKPADAYIRNWGLTVPLTAAGGAVYGSMGGTNNAPTEDQLQQLKADADEKMKQARQVWGTVGPAQ